jgi:hypothetical protein
MIYRPYLFMVLLLQQVALLGFPSYLSPTCLRKPMKQRK